MLSDYQKVQRDLSRHPNDPRNDDTAWERVMERSIDQIYKLSVEEFMKRVEGLGMRTYDKVWEVVDELARENISEDM